MGAANGASEENSASAGTASAAAAAPLPAPAADGGEASVAAAEADQRELRRRDSTSSSSGGEPEVCLLLCNAECIGPGCVAARRVSKKGLSAYMYQNLYMYARRRQGTLRF